MTRHDDRTVVFAHPSPDVYGSDLQALETISGFVADGWRVVLVVPHEGPLLPLARDRGAEARVVPFPTVHRGLLAPAAAARFARESLRSLLTLVQGLRYLRPDAVWVNTLTEPIWLAAARVAGIPAVVHVHEAEQDAPRLMRAGLAAQIALARTAVVNSRAAAQAITDVIAGLAPRIELVYNGVEGPAMPAQPRSPHDGPARIALVGRLSPRKGTDIALEATALLRTSGIDAHLDLYGAVFPGYEWFEEELRARAARPDLAGAVTFHGYVRPVWDGLAASDVVVVPSRTEPFGNVAVEAQLAGRPVVVAAVQGLTEIVDDGRTGLHTPPESPERLSLALREVLDSPHAAERLAATALTEAQRRFSVGRYRAEIAQVLDAAVAA